MFNYRNTRGDIRIGKIVLHAVVGIFILITFFGSFGTVNAGERGIKLRFGAVTGEVLGEGLYFKMPFIEHVTKMNVQIQKEQTKADAASRDLQTVNSDVALNFRVEPAKVVSIYRELGAEYKANVIAPALQESMKAATAKYTAEELITKRGQVAQDVMTVLRERLQSRGIVVEGFSIVNFDFSQAFNEAIESKVSAEQNALAAQNKLKQIEYESQQAVVKAKGEAEAITVKSAALRSNPEVLQLEAIQKWSGQMPQVVGGNTLPFIEAV